MSPSSRGSRPSNISVRAFTHYLFAGFLALCLTVTVVAAMGFYRIYEQKARADGYINEVLDAPSSEYQSAVDALANGAQMIAEARSEIRPPLSSAELQDVVDRLVQQHLNPDQINQRLQGISGTARLRRANAALAQAAARVDQKYEKLAACFRSVECRPGAEFDGTCAAVRSIRRSIDVINTAARRIPGVNLSASGAPPMFGGGPWISISTLFLQATSNILPATFVTPIETQFDLIAESGCR
jgi:hypothetical protein